MTLDLGAAQRDADSAIAVRFDPPDRRGVQGRTSSREGATGTVGDNLAGLLEKLITVIMPTSVSTSLFPTRRILYSASWQVR